jgi:hypothetical protein
MRLLPLAVALILGLTVATTGEAQYRATPSLDVEYAPPDIGPLRDRGVLPPVAPPPCSSGPGRDIVLGALFGTVVAGTVVFVISLGRAAKSLGRDRVNGTPYVVAGALAGAVIGVVDWRRRCG